MSNDPILVMHFLEMMKMISEHLKIQNLLCNDNPLVSKIWEWYLPHLIWYWEGPSFAQVKSNVHDRDVAIKITNFPREPLSQTIILSLFILKISSLSPATLVFPNNQKPHENPISWVLNEELRVVLDVNGCPKPYETLWSWIDHLSILRNESPLH